MTWIANNIVSLLGVVFVPFAILIYRIIELRIMGNVSKKVSPVHAKIDDLIREDFQQQLKNENRFTRLESEQKFVASHLEKLEVKLEGKLDDLSRKLDSQNAALTNRLDDWMERESRIR